MAKASTQPLVEVGRVPLLYLDANILYLRTIFLDLARCATSRSYWHWACSGSRPAAGAVPAMN